MRSKKVNMLEGNSGKALLFFAFPMILGNLLQQFYNIMDSAIVGKYVGEGALASVGASYAITNVFIAVAVGGGVGSSIIVSQYFGAQQLKKMKTAVMTTLINFLIISVAMGIVGIVMNEQILTWMNTPDDVFHNAAVYLSIYFFGLPFLFMYNVQASIFNALGDSRTPLYLLIFSSILNIGLDFLFIMGLKKGVEGAAVATLIAQGFSAVVSFVLLMKQMKNYSCEKSSLYDRRISVSIFKLAMPSVLQQSVVYVGMLLVQTVVNGFGSTVLAGFTAGMRIEAISIVPMIAVGNAMSTFTAQNSGAGRPDRIRNGYRACYFIMGSIALVLWSVLQMFGKMFLELFLNKGGISGAFITANEYVSFLSYFYILIGLKAATDGVLRGAGDMFVFTTANLLNLSIRVFVAFYFANSWGVRAVWVAVPMGWGVNYAVSLVRYLSGKWRQIDLINNERNI